MKAMDRPQTGIKRGEDGRFKAYCRICPKRQRNHLGPDEQADRWFDTKDEALEQGRRHRRSDFHQNVVLTLAFNPPTNEERVLAKILGTEVREPCEVCGFHHHIRLGCLQAAQIRDRELL
jgi:hypothetical protein